MKKLSLIALALCLVFAAAGCAKNGEAEAPTDPAGAAGVTGGVSAEEAVQMSTPELVEAAVASSGATVVLSGKSYRDTALDFAQNTPAVAELLRRSDNAEALLQAYKEAIPPTEEDAVNADKPEFWRFYTLGMLLAQPEVTANMDEALRAEADAVAQEKDEVLTNSILEVNTYTDALKELARNKQ